MFECPPSPSPSSTLTAPATCRMGGCVACPAPLSLRAGLHPPPPSLLHAGWVDAWLALHSSPSEPGFTHHSPHCCLQAGWMRGLPCTPLPRSRASPTTRVPTRCCSRTGLAHGWTGCWHDWEEGEIEAAGGVGKEGEGAAAAATAMAAAAAACLRRRRSRWSARGLCLVSSTSARRGRRCRCVGNVCHMGAAVGACVAVGMGLGICRGCGSQPNP